MNFCDNQYLQIMKSLFILEIVVINMSILAKARYENHVLKPMQDLPLDEGESVIIEIKRSIADQMCGLWQLMQKLQI